MRFELWEGDDEDGVHESALIAETDVKSRELVLKTPYLRHTWTVEAESRDEASQLYYDHMGWGHYSTAEESTGPIVELYGVYPAEGDEWHQ
jgi:hypothetical protein